EGSCGGRRDERHAEGRLLAHPEKGVVAEHDAGEGRYRRGRSPNEERAGPRDGDPGQRQHRVAIDTGGPDRRIPDRGESRRARPRKDDVRRHQREVDAETDQDASLRQRECRAVLPADGVTEARTPMTSRREFLQRSAIATIGLSFPVEEAPPPGSLDLRRPPDGIRAQPATGDQRLRAVAGGGGGGEADGPAVRVSDIPGGLRGAPAAPPTPATRLTRPRPRP